jgi:hypothetical protein
MFRRIAYLGRQRIRAISRRLLDRIDPPAAVEPPPSAPLRVDVEATPNPLALRYGLSRPVGQVDGHTPLGRALLALDGVASVYGTADFVAVTRAADADGDAVHEQVLAVLHRML